MKRPKVVRRRYTREAWKRKQNKALKSLANLAKQVRYILAPEILFEEPVIIHTPRFSPIPHEKETRPQNP